MPSNQWLGARVFSYQIFSGHFPVSNAASVLSTAGSGRELKLHLTHKGEAIVRQRILPIEQAENEVFEEMTEEEHQQILHLSSGPLLLLSSELLR